MNLDPLGRQIAKAGVRSAAPEHLRSETRLAVHQAWLDQLRNHRRSVKRRWLAAALVVVSAGAAWIGMPVTVHRSGVAGVFLTSRGGVDIDSGQRLAPTLGGSSLPVGTRIHTRDDGYVLLAVGDASVRVGPATDVYLERADRLRLGRGRVYVDFPAQGPRVQSLQVETSFGWVQHLGTLFQVMVDQRQLRVGVREGSVKVVTSQGERILGGSEALEVDGAGYSQLRKISPYGDDWAWANELRPDFPIEGLSLQAFLTWYARETGRHVEYDSDATRSAAQSIRLSGSISGLTPDRALEAVIASTQLRAQSTADGTVRVTLRNSAHVKLSGNEEDFSPNGWTHN